jgi:hypothetical protein
LPAVTPNVPAWAPWGIVTDAGSVTAEAGLAVKAAAVPPAGAGAVSVIVQEEAAGAAKATGVQVNPLSPGWMVTVPPVAEVPSVEPDESAAELFASCNWEEESVVWLIGRLMVARTPVETVVSFSPHRMQVADPALALHESCLFADVVAGPAVIVAAPKSAVAYASVHWSAAGREVAVFKLRFKVTELPAAAAPDESPIATDWPRQSAADRVRKMTMRR